MKVLVVDDHTLIRDALRGVLEQLRDDAVVVEAADAREAVRLVEHHPDLELVLLDLLLPDGSGFDVLATLRERHPAVSVVVLSARKDRDEITRALALGALGFIPKSARREIMLGALELVFSGGVYVPPEILEPGRPEPSGALPDPVTPETSLAGLGLTERQIEVLGLMMRGKSNKAICRELDIAEPTVKNHVGAILRAFGASNRTEAVIAAGALLEERRAPER